MTVQRRRYGRPATFYFEKDFVDRRGNTQRKPDMENGITVRVAEYTQRGNKAEVPGQQEVYVTRLLLDWEAGKDLSLLTRIHYLDKWWDVAAPPMPHFGPRATKHWSVDIRERTGGFANG